MYDMVAVINVLPAALKNSLLLIHTLCGSDTTSRLYNHRYAAITSNKIPSKSIADVFYNKDSSMDEIFTDFVQLHNSQKWTLTSKDI